MGEAADDYDFDILGGGGGSEHERVMEWETGLPGADELTPLSQPLVPPGLAAAFRIPPEPGRTLLDVHRASAATVSSLRRASSSSSFPAGGNGGSAPSSKAAAAMDDADSSAAPAEASAGAAVKRPRLVWTPQLHKRFVDVVAHLGIKNAVPKTIMQLMNVEGLTRENVASHLQKYRLYVKRMQGLSNEGPSPSDHIFASTPVPQSLHEPQVPVPMPYAAPAAAMYRPVPMGMAVGMVPMNGGHGHHHNGHAVYNGYGHGHAVSYPQYHHGDK